MTDANDRLGSHAVPKLGVDDTGAVHYYDEPHDRVLVTRDGDVEYIEDLDGRPVTEWAEYVAEQRGWDINYLDAGFAEILRRQMPQATAQ